MVEGILRRSGGERGGRAGMRVLLISHLYPAPGYDRHLFVHEQALALRAAGAEVSVVSPVAIAPPGRRSGRLRAAAPAACVLDGIPVVYPRVPLLPRRLAFARSGEFYLLGLLPHLRSWRRQKFDLIHAHQALPDGAAAQRLARLLDAPYVVTVHGVDVNVNLPGGGAVGARAAAVLARASAVVAVSSAVARRLRGYVPQARLHVINNGGGAAETPRLPQDAETRPPAGDDPAQWPSDRASRALLVSVGHLIPSKGQALVLEALSLLGDEFGDVRYAVVGEGRDEARLRALAARLGLNQRVRFLGRLSHADTLALMARADLFVLPSSPEGFGLVYTEALSQGTPVLACEGEGPEDFVEPGVSGWLVRPGEARAVAQALAEALADRERLKAMGEAGKRAVAGLTWAANAARHMALYRDVVCAGPREGLR